MKILLLSPPTSFTVRNELGEMKKGEQRTPPLGLGYIAAVLQREGYQVNLIDLFNCDFKNAEKIIQAEHPEMVCISCLTWFRGSSIKLAEVVKSVDSEIKVVMGGPHATIMWEQMLYNYPAIDYIVRGEGEITTHELLSALDSGSDLKNVKGIAFRESRKLIKTEDRPLIQDIDSLPFPAHNFFDFDAYDIENYRLKDGTTTGKLRKASAITSRGCPYKCQYCSTTLFWGNKWRHRSPKNVVDEMEMLYNDHRIRFLIFVDDIFTTNKKRTIEICKEIIDRKLDIYWNCCTRPEFVSEEMLDWLAKAGCHMISYGVESGSPQIQTTIHKRLPMDKVAKAFEITNKAGIDPIMLLMVGNPGESEKTIDETLQLIQKCDPKAVSPHIAVVYPGTELYDIAKNAGMIDNDYWLNLDLSVPVYTVERDIETLKKYRQRIETFFAHYNLVTGIKKGNIRKIAIYARYKKNTFSSLINKFMIK